MKRRIARATSIAILLTWTSAAAPSWADPPTPTPAPVTRETVVLATAGLALAGAGAAVAFGVLALQNRRDFDKNPTYANADKGNNDAAYADGGVALAVSAGITSLVLWLTRETPQAEPATPPPATRPAHLSASVFVTPHGGSAGALVRF